jgi:hypothetical protein
MYGQIFRYAVSNLLFVWHPLPFCRCHGRLDALKLSRYTDILTTKFLKFSALNSVNAAMRDIPLY